MSILRFLTRDSAGKQDSSNLIPGDVGESCRNLLRKHKTSEYIWPIVDVVATVLHCCTSSAPNRGHGVGVYKKGPRLAVVPPKPNLHIHSISRPKILNMRLTAILACIPVLVGTGLASGRPHLPYKIDTHHHFLPQVYRAGSFPGIAIEKTRC